MSAGDSSAERPPTSGNRNISGLAPKRIHPAVVWAVALAIVLLGLKVYRRSLQIMPLSDDWGFLDAARNGPEQVFFSTGNYHYNPIAQGVMYLVYLLFGIQRVPYHVVALTLFSIGVVLILHLGWKLTGSFAIGVLASLLFVLSGRQYEGVIWTLVSIFQTLGLVFYLGGLLLYLHAQDYPQGARRRIWLLVGFYACMVLAVFTYEQEATLFVACMLYRLFVLERGQGFGWKQLLARARTWAFEFGFPVIFFTVYLGFKYWLAMKTGRSQAPGLQSGFEQTLIHITVGIYQSFTPGIASSRLLSWQLAFLRVVRFGEPFGPFVRNMAIVLVPFGVLLFVARPVYRWLALWSLLVVASTVLGIGILASRYLLLFLVPAVIILAGLLVWIAKLFRRLIYLLLDNLLIMNPQTDARLKWTALTAMWLPVIAFVALYGLLGVRYTLAQEVNWQQASDIQQAAIHRIADLGNAHPAAQRLYLVNVPDALPAPAGWFEHGAYVFQDGGGTMITFTIPGRFQAVNYVRTSDFLAIGTPVVIPRTKVDALSHDPANLVVCFSKQTRQIEVWGPLCT